ELASRIGDKVNEANNAIVQIRRIKRELADRVQKSQSADVKAIAEQFTKEMVAVEEDVYQVRNQSNQDPLNFPIKTNNRLAPLLRGAVSGEGRPSAHVEPNSRERSAEGRRTGNVDPIFRELSAELDGHTTRLNKTVADQLPAFNRMLTRIK